MSNYKYKKSLVVGVCSLANRILYFASIFLISSSLALSPILSSPVFYSQKFPNVESDLMLRL